MPNAIRVGRLRYLTPSSISHFQRMFTFTGNGIEFNSALSASMAIHLTQEVCVALSGAPDCSVVQVGVEGGFAFLLVKHPAIIEMRRQLFFLPTGAMDLHNQRIRLAPAARGTRFLARSIASQVRGIDMLSTHSELRVGQFSSVVVKRDDAPRPIGDVDPDIGYWLLPQMGFDTPFPAPRELLAAKFPHVSPKSLTLLLANEKASRWWLQVGHTYSFALRFDLAASSRSRLFLGRYTGSTPT